MDEVQLPIKLDGPDVLVAAVVGGHLFWHAIPATGWMKHKGSWLFYKDQQLVAQYRDHQVESIIRRS